MSRPRISDAQANAEALARRGTPFASDYRATVTVAWDWRRRAPRDLREAVRTVRQAYADEVPRRMSEGPDSIGEDGTPRFAPQAEAYIFGAATGTDGPRPGKCDCGQGGFAGPEHETGCATEVREVVSFYRTPFRALLSSMEHGQEGERKRAAIVRHVTIGSQGPKEAAIREGVPDWCAGTVAEDALRGFISRLSDVRVEQPTPDAEGLAA